MREANRRLGTSPGAARAALALAACAAVHAQTQVDLVKTITQYANPPGLAAGIPDGWYALSAAENIDLFSGRLSYELPLVRVGGRGGAGYTISLKIPSMWEASSQTHCDVTENFGNVCTPAKYYASFGGYHAARVEYGPGVILGRRSGSYGRCLYLGITPNRDEYRMTSTRTTIVFVDSHGSEHELFDTALAGQYATPANPAACADGSPVANRGRIFTARDGTAMTFVADANVMDSIALGTGTGGIPAGRLYFADGTLYRVNSSGRVTYIRDRFGNITTLEYSPSDASELVRIVDPEGREVTIAYSAASDTITFPKTGGGSQTIVIGYAALANRLRADYVAAGIGTSHELFSAVNDWCAENNEPRATCLVNPALPATVVLPNSRSYQFRYNRHAELAEVVLPTGGRTEYDWSGGEAGTPEDGYIGSQDLTLIHRNVKQRRAYPTTPGTTAARTTFFEPGAQGSGVTREEREAANSVNAPHRVLHFYHGAPTTSSFLQPGVDPYWNHGKEHTTDEMESGTRLKSTVSEWVELPSKTPVIQSVTTKLRQSLPGDPVSEIWAKTTNVHDWFANVTETTETDWANGAPGAVARKTVAAYVTDASYTHAGETNAANYKVHLRRLPLSETTYRVGQGVETQEARREFIYDEAAYPAQACSGILRHDTNPPASATPVSSGFDQAQYLQDNPERRNASFTRFGNLTTAKRWKEGTSFVSTHGKYDIAGNGVWAQDGRGIEWTATYPGTNAFAYPWQVSVGAAPAPVWQMTWDLSTGKLTNHVDPNGVATKIGYEAGLGRMNSRITAYGTAEASEVSLEYNDASQEVTLRQDLEQTDSGLRRKESTSSFDGLGRLVEERRKTGGTDIVTRTEYDGLGRVWRRSVPAAASANWETMEYDGLARVTRRSWSDGSHEDTKYLGVESTAVGEKVRVTDAAGKWRILVRDGLGRTRQVSEPAGAGTRDTVYTYNSLDGLKQVDQAGRTARTFDYDGLGRLTAAANPESGTSTYSYDGNSNLVTRRDARLVTMCMGTWTGTGCDAAGGYDVLNRPLKRSYSDGTASVTFTYEGLRLTGVTAAGVASQGYTYTAGGRVATSTQTVDGASYGVFSYEYYRDGSMKSETYPSGRKISYLEPDLAGRATKVEGLLSGALKTYVSAASYNEHGLLAAMTLGTANNLVERWSYSAKRLQPFDIRVGTAAMEDSVGRWELSYCQGMQPGVECAANNGNVLHQRIKPLSAVQNYAYDELNRVVAMEETAAVGAAVCTGAGSAPCRGFGYDDWGNLYVSAARGVATNSFTPVNANWFDGNNRLKNAGLGVVHDAAGHQTGIGGFVNAYDGEGRLASTTIGGVTTSYGYDGAGRRVKKSVGAAATVYVYDAGGRLAAEYGGTVPAGAGTRYVVGDHLGSTRLVLKEDGTVDRRVDYLPFGEFMPAGVGGRTAGQGYEASEDVGGMRWRFAGKERDAETGLDYFGARYFSGAQGRFTSPDPLLGSANPLNPQSWNRYSYTLNNPLRYTDPFGLYEWDATLGGSATDDELRKQLSKRAANKIIDRRNDIRKAITKGAGSNDADVSGAYQAYGAEGEANGVTVASQKPKSGGVGAAGQQLEYIDGSFRSKATVSIDPNQSGNDLFITLGHEGSHVRDGQAYAAAAGRLGDVPALGPFNLTVLQTEMNAYSTSVNAARMLGLPNLNYSAGGQAYQIWRGGTAAVDRPILEQYLRASPLYNQKLNSLMFPR